MRSPARPAETVTSKRGWFLQQPQELVGEDVGRQHPEVHSSDGAGCGTPSLDAVSVAGIERPGCSQQSAERTVVPPRVMKNSSATTRSIGGKVNDETEIVNQVGEGRSVPVLLSCPL